MSTPEPQPLQRLGQDPEVAGLGWYVRSLAPRDVHRGVLTEGSVHAVCGITFFPQLDANSDRIQCIRLPQSGQVCPACVAQTNGQVVVIPAVCSRHSGAAGVLELVVRGLGDGRIELEGLGPIWDTWRDTPITDPAHAQQIWSQQPYGVLLVCGRGVDVLELPHRLFGRLPAPEVPQVPLAATAVPPRRWLLFTATGSGALSGELASAKVRLHTAGAWVALPPTTVEFLSPQRWLEPPQRPATRRLRTADEVQHGLLTLLLRSGKGADDDTD